MSVGQAQAADTPPLVVTEPADYIYEDSARLNGTVDAFGTDITECYFDYGLTSAYGMQADCNPPPVFGDGPTAAAGKVVDLLPDTKYHYRLVARNAFGLGIGSDRTLGTGSDETPPSDPGEESGNHDPVVPSNPAQPSLPPSEGSTSPPQMGSPGCPVIKLIGVRGSGEPQGLGKPVGAFARALASELDMRPDDGDFGIHRLLYPAKPVDIPKHVGNDFGPLDFEKAWTKQMFGTPYNHSVEDGVRSLTDALRLDPCATDTRYVVAGYSQGADVIGDAIEDLKIGWYSHRIVATVLFGDPMFDTRMTGVDFYGSASKRGLLTKLHSRRRNSFHGYHVLSFCRRTDPFCQSNVSALAHRRTAGHEHYQDQEAKQAAKLVAALWQP